MNNQFLLILVIIIKLVSYNFYEILPEFLKKQSNPILNQSLLFLSSTKKVFVDKQDER